VGELTKPEVRARAHAMGLRTADKPESMDVCFIAKTGGGRKVFLGNRIPLRTAKIVDTAGGERGTVEGLELITYGQRRGLGAVGDGAAKYVVGIDMAAGVVTVGDFADLLVASTTLHTLTFSDSAVSQGSHALLAQCSAHGEAIPVTFDAATSTVTFETPRPRVAPGQSIVLYRGEVVVAGGIAV
jgi:tRNA-uridine 2-sulfurtransferase